MCKLLATFSALLIGTAAFTAAPASASTTHTGVVCYGNVNDLQDVLNAANAGDTIQLIAGETCGHTAYNFSPGHVPVTLDGNGATLDGTGIVPAGSAPPLSGADVQGTTIKNLTFVNGNVTSGDGGALDLTGDSVPTLINDRFYSSSSSGYGGAVAINTSAASGTITVRNSIFGSATKPNSAGIAGGALEIRGAGPGMGTPSVVLSADSFVANHSGNAGGGLNFAATGTNGSIAITGSTFSANTTQYGGAGAAIGFTGLNSGVHPQATLTGNKFIGNRAQSNSNFANGAGLELYGTGDGTGSVLQSGNLFQKNAIPRTSESNTQFFGYGAGEYDDFLPLTSVGDRFVGNSIAPNTASDVIWGAGLAIAGCGAGMPANLVGDVVAGNTVAKPAPAGGAGVYVGLVCTQTSNGVALSLLDTTISGNTAAAGGVTGVLGETTDTLTAKNSIIAGNPGGSDLGGFASRAVNHSDACSSGAPVPGTANFCKPPHLKAPLSGDVHETAASPTIDKGLNSEVPAGLTKDVYGSKRITNGLGMPGPAIVDIGATESAARAPCVVPKLKGRSLKAARLALTQAHCALGKVTRRKHKPRAKLVVVKQSRRPGTKLTAGTKIAVTLGAKP